MACRSDGSRRSRWCVVSRCRASSCTRHANRSLIRPQLPRSDQDSSATSLRAGSVANDGVAPARGRELGPGDAERTDGRHDAEQDRVPHVRAEVPADRGHQQRDGDEADHDKARQRLEGMTDSIRRSGSRGLGRRASRRSLPDQFPQRRARGHDVGSRDGAIVEARTEIQPQQCPDGAVLAEDPAQDPCRELRRRLGRAAHDAGLLGGLLQGRARLGRSRRRALAARRARPTPVRPRCAMPARQPPARPRPAPGTPRSTPPPGGRSCPRSRRSLQRR